MERATRVPSLIEGFKNSDALTSETSVPVSVWSSAKGVMQNDGAACRMNGKTIYGKIATPILAFAQMADFVVVQTISSVFTVSNEDFFGAPVGFALLNEDGETLLNEDGNTLTT